MSYLKKLIAKSLFFSFVGGFSMMFFACSNETNPITDSEEEIYEYLDSIFPEVDEFLDELPAEKLTSKDITLENGNNLVDFLLEYDPEFVEEHPWILELKNIVDDEEVNEEVKAYSSKMKASNITGNKGIANLRNDILSKFVSGCLVFANIGGKAHTSSIQKKIAEHDQLALWYKYGGHKWDVYSKPMYEPTEGEKKMCFGLDCSGLIYSGMNYIGYGVGDGDTERYSNTSVWQAALSGFVAQMKDYPDEIKGNLKFDKYVYSRTEFPTKIRGGDIVLCYKNNSVTHMGLATFDGKIVQSNGPKYPRVIEDCFNNGRRGPHIISVSNIMTTGENGFNFTKFGVVRLVATLNNTHWRLNIKCEGKDTYITSFDIEINMQESTKGEITIEPVHTIGHDYNGAPCDVYFTGTFNPETQILKGSVKKTYSADDTRTDGFEIKVTDDSIYDIQEYRIVSNGGCINYLDLENLDNKTVPASARKRIKVNTSSTVLQQGDCADHNVYVY